MYKQILAALLMIVLLTGCTPAAIDNATENGGSIVTDTGTSEEWIVSEMENGEGDLTSSDTTNSSQAAQASSCISSPPYPVRIPPSPTPIVDQFEHTPDERPKQPAPFQRASVDACYIFAFYSPGSQPPAPNNAGAPDDYITVEYDAGVLLGSLELTAPVRYVGTEPVTIEQFHYAFPIECLRQIDENTYYAVYKTQQGGYFYVHFQKMFEEPSWDNQLYNGCMAMTAYSYVAEKHSSTDFENIQIGDSYNKLEEIDSSACLWIYAQLIDRLDSCLILEDGVMRICATKNEQGEYVIHEKQFYEGGKVDYGPIPPLSMHYEETGLILNQNILPQDFPQ